MNHTTQQFGTLYLDAEPQLIAQKPSAIEDIPVYNGEATISIGNSYRGNIITWIQPNGMDILIADRILLTKVSWDDLNKQGFVDGKEIYIDGMCFRCRLLNVGNIPDISNEWDDILDIASEDDGLWHWKGMYFWGQEASMYGASLRAIRGYRSARHWSSGSAIDQSGIVGFRPALEPLGPENPLSGKEVVLEGQRFRTCIHSRGCRRGEGLFRQARRIFAGILCGLQENSTRHGGKRPGQTAFEVVNTGS